MLFYQVGELVPERGRWSEPPFHCRADGDSARIHANGAPGRSANWKFLPRTCNPARSFVVKPGEQDSAGRRDSWKARSHGQHRGPDGRKRCRVDRAAGENVVSGSVNLNGAHHACRYQSVYGESTVAKILNLMEESASKKAQAEGFITRFAKVYTPCVVIGAAAAVPVFRRCFFGGAWAEWVGTRADLPGSLLPLRAGGFGAAVLLRRAWAARPSRAFW